MRLFSCLLGTALVFAPIARAAVTLPDLFSDHAVLQASRNTPIWGKAEPGEAVAVTLGPVQSAVTANHNGTWQARLDLSAVGPGPFTLTVQGKNLLTVSDVAVGQVWLCSGQSNMEFPLARSGGGKEEVERSANPMLRQFHVDLKASPIPLAEAHGKWTVAGSQSAGSFTAVGYYFGKRLQRELNTPVGLLNASWGGSCIEAWCSAEGLDVDLDLKEGRKKVMAAYADFQNFSQSYKQWQTRTQREDKPTADPLLFAGLTIAEPDWKSVTLPGLFSSSGLPDTGAVWLRRKIVISPEAASQPLDIFLGDPRDAVQIYWNGKKIGEGNAETTIQRYKVGGGLVVPGDNVIAIRVFSPARGGGILGGPRFSIDMRGKTLTLAGEWLAKAEYKLAPPDAAALESFPKRPAPPTFHIPTFNEQNIATYLFNGMIHPILPYAIAGTAWYQGEQNLGYARQYETAFPLLIADWRARWGWEFPFLFCQLPNYGSPIADAEKSVKGSWPELREGQTKSLALPKTGEAVLIDVGEAGNIHPANKKEPGERLARIALATVYGREIVCSGPTFDAMEREKGKIRVHFRNIDRGLVSKLPPLSPNDPSIRSEVEGFVICGEDRKWRWAKAKIEGTTVLVWADSLADPREVRYAWADNPSGSLYNGASLPAAPFRTDDFPGVTDTQRYGDVPHAIH